MPWKQVASICAYTLKQGGIVHSTTMCLTIVEWSCFAHVCACAYQMATWFGCFHDVHLKGNIHLSKRGA